MKDLIKTTIELTRDIQYNRSRLAKESDPTTAHRIIAASVQNLALTMAPAADREKLLQCLSVYPQLVYLLMTARNTLGDYLAITSEKDLVAQIYHDLSATEKEPAATGYYHELLKMERTAGNQSHYISCTEFLGEPWPALFSVFPATVKTTAILICLLPGQPKTTREIAAEAGLPMKAVTNWIYQKVTCRSQTAIQKVGAGVWQLQLTTSK